MRRRLLAEARWQTEALVTSKPPCTVFQRFKSKSPSAASSSYLECAEDKAHGCEEKVQETVCVDPRSSTMAWRTRINEHLLESKQHMASLQEEMSSVHRVLSSMRTDLHSHIAADEVLMSCLKTEVTNKMQDVFDQGEKMSDDLKAVLYNREQVSEDMKMLQDRMEKGVVELEDNLKSFYSLSLQDMNMLQDRMEKQVVKLEDIGSCVLQPTYVLSDKALERALDNQLRSIIDKCRAHVEEMGGKTDADQDPCSVASLILGPFLKGQLTSLHNYLSKIDSSMAIVQDKVTDLRIDMAHAYDKQGWPPLTSHVRMVPSTSVAAEIKDLLLQIDVSLQGLRENLHQHANAGTLTTNENRMQLALLEKMKTMINAQSTMLHNTHGEMERLCGVVATMDTRANGVWSNIIEQEKYNMETQKMMQTLLSFVESYAANKDRANGVLVKVVSAFLVCSVALHAWTVWSLNSCYPL